MVNKKIIRITLGILQAFVSLGAIPAGYSMIKEPDGYGLGMSKTLLVESPFDSYFIPGLYLLIVNGLFNDFAALLSFKGNRYSGLFGIITGSLLALWIVMQVIFIGYLSFMQPMFFIIGAVEIALGITLLSEKIKIV